MHKLNPGYKFIAFLIVSLMLSFTYTVSLNICIFIICMVATVLTPGTNKKRMLIGLIPFVLTAAGLFISGLFFSAGSGDISGSWGEASVNVSSMAGAMQLSSRVLAFGGIGILFALTTKSEELIMSFMQQFKLPPKFAYGTLAAYHFLPVVADEYRIVKAAFKVRGIKVSPLSPRFMIPMLVHAFERSESIAMAMESRGFSGEEKRKVIHPVGLCAADIILAFIIVGAMVTGIIVL